MGDEKDELKQMNELLKEIEEKYDKLILDSDVGVGEELGQLLLVSWDLTSCVQKFKDSRWIFPNEWDQLTVPALVYEVGVEKEDAEKFMTGFNQYQIYRQKKTLDIYNVD